MKVDLSKQDLIYLVKGVSPFYSMFDNPLIARTGSFNGSLGKWNWNYSELNLLSEEELYNLYLTCKNSWK